MSRFAAAGGAAGFNGEFRTISLHYVEWALGGLHRLNGDTTVQAAHCPRTPAIAGADGQSGHGLPPLRTLPGSTGIIRLSRAAAVTA
ncbi:hypothetical protein, partial [Xenorhabdus sp. IM139775]|uniref:hypothetical protein n=1 Tax=Xenorhabdus sp. IM139775 TaxID=3025876 RepID=UPI0023592336